MKGSRRRGTRSRRVGVQKRDKDFAYFDECAETENSPIKSNDVAVSPEEQKHQVQTRAKRPLRKRGEIASPPAKKMRSSRAGPSAPAQLDRGTEEGQGEGQAKNAVNGAETKRSPTQNKAAGTQQWSISPNSSASDLSAVGQSSTNVSELMGEIFKNYYRDVSSEEMYNLLGMKPASGTNPLVISAIPKLESFKSSDFEVIRFEDNELPAACEDVFNYCQRDLGLVDATVEMQVATQANFDSLFDKEKSKELYGMLCDRQLNAISFVDSAQNGKVVAFVLWNILVCPIGRGSKETVKVQHIPRVWLDSQLDAVWPISLMVKLCAFASLSEDDGVQCAFASVSKAHLGPIQTITKCFTIRCHDNCQERQMISILDPCGLANSYKMILSSQVQGFSVRCNVGSPAESRDKSINVRLSAESSEWIESAPLRSNSFSDLSLYCTDAISQLERELEAVTQMNLQKKRLLCESYVQAIKRRDEKRESEISAIIDKSKKEDIFNPLDFTDSLLCAKCDQDSRYGDLIVICDRCERGWHQSCHGITEIPSGEWFCKHCKNLDLSKIELASVRGIQIIPTKLFREVKNRGGFNHVNKVRGSWIAIGRAMSMPAVTNLSFLLKQAYIRYFHSDSTKPQAPRRPVGRPRGSGKKRSVSVNSDPKALKTPPRKRGRPPKSATGAKSSSKRKYTKRKLKVDASESKARRRGSSLFVESTKN